VLRRWSFTENNSFYWDYLDLFRFRELQEQRLKTTQLPNGKTNLLPEEDRLTHMGLWEDPYEEQDRSKPVLSRDVLEDMETEGTGIVQLKTHLFKRYYQS